MTVRTLAEVLYHLDTQVKLQSQPVPWARGQSYRRHFDCQRRPN